MAGAQTRGITATFGLRSGASLPPLTWKAQSPGASLPPLELLSSQPRFARALPLGEGRRFGVPPGD